MIRAVFLTLALISMATFAAEPQDCELRLTTTIAVIVDRALTQAKLKLEDVQAMVDSEVPLNPLRTRIGFSDVGALRSYFEVALPTVTDWDKVREELRSVLTHHGFRAEMAAGAREHTSKIFSNGQFERAYPGRLVDGPRRIPTGQVVFTVEENWIFRTFEPGKAEPISDLPPPTPRPPKAPQGYEVDEKVSVSGDVFAFRKIDGSYNHDMRMSRDIFLYRRSGNGKLKPVNAAPLRYEYRHQVDELPPIQVLQLHDGQFVVAGVQPAKSWTDSSIGYYAPFAENLGRAPVSLEFVGTKPSLRLFEAEGGRVFVVAHGLKAATDESRVAVYEPAQGVEPIFDHYFPGQASDAVAFEREGRAYVGVLVGNLETYESTFFLFAIGESQAPILTYQIKGLPRLVDVVSTPDQVYLYTGTSLGLSSHLLLTRSRS